MNRRTWVAAAGVAAAAVGVGGAALFGSLAGAQPGPAQPEAADLSSMVNSILDPTLEPQSRGSEPLDVVSGPGVDPLLYHPAAVAAGDTVVQSIDVTKFDIQGDTATATAIVSINGVPNEQLATIPFVSENGEWKIDRSFVCALTTGPGGPQPGCE